jgi:bacteriorhodopsin
MRHPDDAQPSATSTEELLAARRHHRSRIGQLSTVVFLVVPSIGAFGVIAFRTGDWGWWVVTGVWAVFVLTALVARWRKATRDLRTAERGHPVEEPPAFW